MNAEKVKKAILRIQHAYEIAEHMSRTLIVAYSGGKDSDVLLDLAIRSSVPFRAEHNHTTADAPETVYHIQRILRRWMRGVFRRR
jgi:phosphoadenosine phosphosulfate reductase